ncbi:MAG TPA: nuclear transport factor 2 family protein [Hyphomicrobiales bacterium]|nr:nuclear transport factor 2 family protein [Hyphomicrobiales bacterium]
MQPAQIAAIEQACTRLVNRFAVYNDLGRFTELAQLFIADGRYARPSAPDTFIEGREAILASFTARPSDKLTRHIISNVVIDVQDEQHASGISYIVLYTAALDNPAKLGLKANPVQLVGEFYDEFVLTAEGWRFSERRGTVSLSVG